ncbi:DUF1840 domain-containing protein [Zoogloea sp.]|uniref:DUF1840 domain-containing protein n=1 Tax=Zoogloea sp. TaxID=49181 RepID=UPI0035B304B3
MLIIFKSPASGDVIMFGKNGKEMLEVLGKDKDDAKGIFTVEQLPAAIDTLKAAIAADKARQADKGDDEDDQDAKPGGGGVSFFQRAVPLLELLERSLKDKEPVTWGV